VLSSPLSLPAKAADPVITGTDARPILQAYACP
jgi:hypothetical protein